MSYLYDGIPNNNASVDHASIMSAISEFNSLKLFDESIGYKGEMPCHIVREPDLDEK